MDAVKSETSNPEAAATNAVTESDIVRWPSTRKPPAESAAAISDNITPLIQKVGAASIAEIDTLIGELKEARDYLQSEGERIHRETARYAHLSQTASASVKIISESVGQWRSVELPARGQMAS